MTKKSIKAEVNTFIKGIVTEASPLNFPKDASLDEQNFELIPTGVRQRRLGLDFEDSYIGRIGLYVSESFETSKVQTYIWEDAAGVSGNHLLVVQSNSRLYFFNTNVASLSSEGYIATIGFPVLEFGVRANSFTSIDGKLIVATGDGNLFTIIYNPSDNTISYSVYRLKVRDLWGVEYADSDNLQYYRPPQSAPKEHFYNLYNQSWGVPRRWEGISEKNFTDPVGYFSAYYGVLPSKEETVWTSITTKADNNPYEYMRPNAWGELFGSTPQAAKGYFIIDLLNRGPSRSLAIQENGGRFHQMNMKTYEARSDTTVQGATIVHEFAGRVFYAGFGGQVIQGDSKSPNLSSYIAFSQLVSSFDDLGKCYQSGDPTSREGNDLVDTDGGLVRISGVNRILGLRDVGSSLLIIGSNGIWSLTGGSDYGFSATNYKVSKISDFGCIAPDSVIKVGETVIYWGVDGIYQITTSNVGDLIVKSLTDSFIQTFYIGLSVDEKANALGVYDEVTKTARWIYYDKLQLGLESGTKELILDTRIGSFYKYLIKNQPNTFVRGMFTIPTFRFEESELNVMVGSDGVLSGSDNVVVPYQLRVPTKSSVKYLTFYGAGDLAYFTFSYYRNSKFRDWEGVDFVGIDANAYLLTGAITAGDSSVDKQTPYITVHMYRTEKSVDDSLTPIGESGCLLRSQWEWSNSVNSNKWSPQYQVYRYPRGYMVGNSSDLYDNGFELISTKNKLRGRGRAVSLHFSTEPYKDCRILGWNLNINGNAIT